MKVVDVIRAIIIPQEFLDRIEKCWNIFDDEVTLDLAREIEINRERQERQEQNLAYQQTKNSDLEEKKKKQQEEIDKVQMRKKKIALLKAARSEALDRYARLVLDGLSCDSTHSVKVGLRLPDGSRIDRYFPLGCKFEVVLSWISGVIAERLTDETFLDDFSPSLESNLMVIPWSLEKYELNTTHPKRSFTIADGGSSLTSLGWGKQVLLLIQR
eukprot:TRINITY_DN1118_c0_g3_i3.p1 TRINITY_DN1118_c0_g3~~TRINITY_DN1118_c0_g3_i3.p1  ORF type:complete len:214 (-),score=65.34 TRINITY_DN1118_c0_g3_i3:117-758(-)